MTQAFNLGKLTDGDRDPAHPALIDLGAPGGPRTWSHGELDAAADAVARGLVRRGMARGDRIAILAANSAPWLIAYLAIMRAGMVAVPVNFKFPASTVGFVLQDAGVSMAFVDGERRPALPAGLPAVMLDEDGADSLDAMMDPGPFETVRPAPGDVAMQLYTSGSTGRPKGVPLTHEGHLWVIRRRLEPMPDPGDRPLVAAPLYHMNALAMCKLALAAHLTIVLMPRFDARAYIAAIGAHRVTSLTSVTAMMAMVVRETEALAAADLSSVRSVRMGSSPVSRKLIDDIRRILPGADITNGYGTTEAGPFGYGRHPDGLAQPVLSVGYPIAGINRLVNGDDPDPEFGELQCRSPALMPGYHNLPEKTAQVMTEDGWYKTGDLMRRDGDGFHYFVGRVDDMFDCGGENIYPSEVEALLERHDAVEQACVVPVSDEIKGFKPVAFVVPVGGRQVEEAELKAYALANGPAYLHPRQITFMANLPLTGTNKVDRSHLTQLAERRAAGAANQDT